MGRGNLILYFKNAENTEVCGDAGLPYRDEAELADRIRQALERSEHDRTRYPGNAAARARERYDWYAGTTQYEALPGGLRE